MRLPTTLVHFNNLLYSSNYLGYFLYINQAFYKSLLVNFVLLKLYLYQCFTSEITEKML